MSNGRMSLIEACEKASQIVSHAQEMDQLYRLAVRYMGEGALRLGILNMATDAMKDEQLQQEIFISDDNLLSFLCGVWIQFLLTEIAGVKKDKLQTLAKKVFADLQDGKSFH